MIKFYLDEDAARSNLIRELRAKGIDVISVHDVGRLGYDDVEQLEYAIGIGRVIFSFNRRDFQRIHTEYITQGKSHTGIVLSFQHFSIGEQICGLQNLLANRSADEMRNQLEYLSSWKDLKRWM